MMKLRFLILLFLPMATIVSLPQFSRANEQIVVLQTLIPDTEVVIGQLIKLNVDLLTSGKFPGQFDILENEGKEVIILPEEGSGTFISKKIKGVSLNGIRKTLLLIPNQSGSLQIPAIVFVNAQDAKQRITTKPLSLQVGIPEGTRNPEKLLISSNVKISQSQQPVKQTYSVGDSVIRSIKVKAEGTLAFKIPPPPIVEVEGLSSYVSVPKLKDNSERGEIYAERNDTIEYIVEKQGIFTLPEISYEWWNPVSKAYTEVTVPSIELHVTNDAPLTKTGDLSISHKLQNINWRQQLIAFLELYGLTILISLFTVVICTATYRKNKVRLKIWISSLRIKIKNAELMAFCSLLAKASATHSSSFRQQFTLWKLSHIHSELDNNWKNHLSDPGKEFLYQVFEAPYSHKGQVPISWFEAIKALFEIRNSLHSLVDRRAEKQHLNPRGGSS